MHHIGRCTFFSRSCTVLQDPRSCTALLRRQRYHLIGPASKIATDTVPETSEVLSMAKLAKPLFLTSPAKSSMLWNVPESRTGKLNLRAGTVAPATTAMTG